jgi:hypothetical protein
MTSTEYTANSARAFMAAEIAMASVNSGAAIVTRARAEKLLDDCFTCLEQAVPWTENNALDRRSDREDRADFIDPIRDMGGGGVAVHDGSYRCHVLRTPFMSAACQARTLNFDGIVGSLISPGAAATADSGIISIA